MAHFEQTNPNHSNITKELEKRTKLSSGTSRSRLSKPKPARAKKVENIPILDRRLEK